MANHLHDHQDDQVETMCPKISPKHAKYISKHLEKVRTKCEGFNHCLDELYSQENTLLILQGKDIELRHICSLLNPRTNEESACTSQERSMIRQDLRTHLNELVSTKDTKHVGNDHNHALMDRKHKPDDLTYVTTTPNPRKKKKKSSFWETVDSGIQGNQTEGSGDGEGGDGGIVIGGHGGGMKDGDGDPHLDPDDHHREEWRDLGKCMQRAQSTEMDSVATVCSLQRNSTVLCGSHAIQHAVESFFNKQLRHLQCTCDALPTEKPIKLLIGASAGGFVFLCFILLMCCLLFRSKKKKQKKNNRNVEGRVKYQIAEKDENESFYSEISGLSMPLKNYRKELAGQVERGEGSSKPDLPVRYDKSTLPGSLSTRELAGSIEYLEPWDSPRFSIADIDYGPPKEDEAPPENPNRGLYFDELKDTEHEDGGYETLTRKKKNAVVHQVQEEEPLPDYYVLEKE